MSGDFEELVTEFQQHLTAARAAHGTERVTRFMDAYEVFKDLHREAGLPVPTARGEELTEPRFREIVTKDDHGTEPDPEAFEHHASMMSEKVDQIRAMRDAPDETSR